MLWLFLLLYDGLQVFLNSIPHFPRANALNFRILHLIFLFLTDHILPDSSIFDKPQLFLSDLLDLPDHVFCLADLLHIFVVVPHHMGAIGETIVLVQVAEEVQVSQCLVLGREESV